MDRIFSSSLVLLLGLGILVAMVFAWRARARRQSHLPAVQAPPTLLGDILGEFAVLYVATTVADTPLERVVVGGLGFRARADVQVATAGISLSIAGESPMFIPATSLRAVGRSTWTIDKVVEEGGLVRIAWNLKPDAGEGAESVITAVDSYFRLADTDVLIAAVSTLIDSTQPSSPTGSTTQ